MDDPTQAGMGTTLCVLLIEDGVAHRVGDSASTSSGMIRPVPHA